MPERVVIYPIPIIGAIHSAWIAASIDMSKAWTAGLVLSATHKTPNGALIASCNLHRQVTIFQILWSNGFGSTAGSVIIISNGCLIWRTCRWVVFLPRGEASYISLSTSMGPWFVRTNPQRDSLRLNTDEGEVLWILANSEIKPRGHRWGWRIVASRIASSSCDFDFDNFLFILENSRNH